MKLIYKSKGIEAVIGFNIDFIKKWDKNSRNKILLVFCTQQDDMKKVIDNVNNLPISDRHSIYCWPGVSEEEILKRVHSWEDEVKPWYAPFTEKY